jgi:mono/diheme cytochrome c family protein
VPDAALAGETPALWIGAWALTEPGAGSDLTGLQATAARDGDEWVLNGTKMWITNAGVSEFYTVMAVTDPDKDSRGISAFVVAKSDPGVSFGPKERKLGIKGSPTRQVIFDKARIPGDRIIGAEGTGFGTALATLDHTRITIAAQACGVAGAAFVAQHGSWNRSKKSGYQVVALHFQADGTITEEPFATGFMIDEKVSGRPVDVAVGPDGALYVSDDFTGAIYRIAYGTAAASAAMPTAHAPERDPLAGLSAAQIEAASAGGAALWKDNGCASCHVGEQAAPNAYRPLMAIASKYTIDSLIAYLHTPTPPMPAFPLTDEQRRDLAVYLMTTYR